MNGIPTNPYSRIGLYQQVGQAQEVQRRPEVGPAAPAQQAAPARTAAGPNAAGLNAAGLNQAEQQMIARYFPESPTMSMRLYGSNRSAQHVNPGAVGSRLDLRG